MAWVLSLTAMQDRYTGNIAAVILVAMLFAANFGRTGKQQTEYRILAYLLGCIGIYSLMEIACGLMDGKPGTVMTVMIYIMNTGLFIANLILEIGWVQLISYHLGYHRVKRTRAILLCLLLLGCLLLAVNFFQPVVFNVRDNVYSEHGPLYCVFMINAAVFFAYTIYIYAVCRRNGGVLKYFPVWLYIAPSVLGIALEAFFRTSFMSVCNAIAISAVLTSMQLETVYRDRLTGLYNRAYLEELKAKLEKTQNPYCSGIMLDLNGFKSINDNYGHAEGDNALIIAAKLIREGVGSFGDVIRYAGDEFVVILNTTDESRLKACVERVRSAFDGFNETKEKPYKLSASAGYANFNAETQTVNEFLNLIDKDMYENKRSYYMTHENNRRRERR